MNNITFVIFAFNEEKRISYVVRNFIKYGDVLIMDGGSTDKTQEISEALGAKFILRPNPENETQENLCAIISNTTTEWIYWGLVDNLASKSLLNKMVSISKQNRYKYILVPLYTYLWGEVRTPALKGYFPCFFMKNSIDFTDNYIHGMGKFLGDDKEILFLPNTLEFALRHYSLYDVNKFLISHLNYANIEASQKFDSGNKFSIFKLIRGMGGYFLMFYRNGYKNGVRGLLVSCVYSLFRFMVYFRLFELENNLNLDTIEAEYVKEKNKILETI